MLEFHEISELRGKVSKEFLDRYVEKHDDPVMGTLVSGFYRSSGFKSEAAAIALGIIESISLDTKSVKERNILVWNMYSIIKELLDEGEDERALYYCKQAEKLWSRDVILADTIGVCHVSWREQLWLKEAEVYMLNKDDCEFEKITDRIITERMRLFNEAERFTGEGIVLDKCTFRCLELMAWQMKRKDTKKACAFLRQAILCRGGGRILRYIKKHNTKVLGSFANLLRLYHKLSDVPFDSMDYLYCKTCRHFDGTSWCIKHSMNTETTKACEQYEYEIKKAIPRGAM